MTTPQHHYGDDHNHNRDNGDDHNHSHNGGNDNEDHSWEGYVGRARANDVSASLALRYVAFLFFFLLYMY